VKQVTLFDFQPKQITALAVAQTTALAVTAPTLIEPLQTVTIAEPCADVNADGAQCVECAGDVQDCLSLVMPAPTSSDPEDYSCLDTSKDVKCIDWRQTQPLNTEDPQIVAMLKKPIALLKGLYTIVRMPTEERLTARFEDLTKESFDRLTEIAETYMREVDAKYAKTKHSRGRSWKGTGHRVSATEPATDATEAAENRAMEQLPWRTGSERTVKFSPFPSSTLNILKTLRKMRADAYHEHCVVLERQEESFQNNINILPYAEVLDFDEKIKEMDAKIDEVNKAITDFQQTEEWTKLLQTLEPYGVADFMRKKTWTVEHCYVLSTDIALDTATVKQHIEDEYRRMFNRVTETEAKALDDFENNQMRTRRSLAEQAIESLRSELSEIVARVVASSQRQPERVKADLERLRRKVVSIGLDQLEPTVTQIIDVFDKPERAYELFGRQNISEVVDERIDALVRSLE
jgi:hypothetical protein